MGDLRTIPCCSVCELLLLNLLSTKPPPFVMILSLAKGGGNPKECVISFEYVHQKCLGAFGKYSRAYIFYVSR